MNEIVSKRNRYDESNLKTYKENFRRKFIFVHAHGNNINSLPVTGMCVMCVRSYKY